jgi:hypothetical protein
MPNQPAPGTTRITMRIPDELKAAILAEVDRILQAQPKSDIKDVSSWIRTAIDEKLRRDQRGKGRSKKNQGAQ